MDNRFPYISRGGIKLGIQIIPKFIGLLDKVKGAVFALSSQLLTRNFIDGAPYAPVRRTSDNVEANVLFDPASNPRRVTLDSPVVITSGSSAAGTLGELVEEEVVTYESDFSEGTDSWSAVRLTATGNIDGIGGEDNTLRLAVNTTNTGLHYYQTTTRTSLGFTYRFKARVYIDSALGQCDGVRLSLGDGTFQDFANLQKDTWHDLEFVGVCAGPVAFARFTLMRGSIVSYSDAEMEDTLYVRDVEITQLTHSAALATGSNQTGGTNATQATAGAQPLIVEAGVLVKPKFMDGQWLPTLPAGDNLMQGDFTICGWAKVLHNATQQEIFGFLNSGSTTALRLICNIAGVNGRITMFVRGETVTHELISSSNAFEDGVWFFYACKKEGADFSLDVNLANLGATTFSDSFSTLGFPMYFGAGNSRGTPSGLLAGQLDHHLIYKRLLSSSDLTAIMEATDPR